MLSKRVSWFAAQFTSINFPDLSLSEQWINSANLDFPVPDGPPIKTGNLPCIILGILLIWALLFGVTIGGKHYGLKGCSFDHGVQIDK